MKQSESALVRFVCPKCGSRIEAMPSATITCRCGRQMEREKPGAKGPAPLRA